VHFLAADPRRAAQAAAAGWDLLVVDEAHHLHWSPEAASPEYQLVEALARVTPGLLLLTATPEQLGVESHFARLRLLDPNRYPDFARYVQERDRYEAVARKAEPILAAGDERALQDLLDRHGPGRVMFRNTRAAMPGFPKRHLHRAPLAPAGPGGSDPRVEWLAGFLRRHPKKKVLAICQTRQDVRRIHEALQQRIEVKTALFHEDLPVLQCDRQAAWFAEPEGARLAHRVRDRRRGPQLPVCAGPGAAGPARRSRRCWSSASAAWTASARPATSTSTCRSSRAHRKRAACAGITRGSTPSRKPVRAAHEILQHFRKRLDKVTPALIKETVAFRRDLQARIERGRDRLLELSSFRPAVAAQVKASIAAVEESRDIEDYLLRLFDQFGVHAEHLAGRDYLLVPGHLFDTAFPLGAEPLRITCDRRQAIAREDIALMSWDHPLLAGGMDLLLGSEKGNSAVAVAEGLKGFLLQAVFVLDCVAPPRLEAGRFLPPTPISVLLRDDGREATARPPRLRDGPPLQLAGAAARIQALLATARERAGSQVPALQAAARAEMRAALGAELERLRALRKVNDHIRPEEIAALEQRLAALDEVLGRAELRLDAVLLIVGG
jgi:ATP-dependent helicase HepA